MLYIFKKWLFPGILIFAMTVISIQFAVQSGRARQARADVVEFIRDRHQDVSVFVNGYKVENPKSIVAAIGSIHEEIEHHSHPTNRIFILIRAGGSALSLTVARDSDYRDEYWVYCPTYTGSDVQRIGRVSTTAFDSYN